jgi:hypothetical protein
MMFFSLSLIINLSTCTVFCLGGAALLAKGAVDFAGKSNDSFFFWFNMVTTTLTTTVTKVAAI